MRRLFIVLCLFAIGLPAQAADEQGRFAVRNAGMQRCSDFLQEKAARNMKFAQYLGWIDGYLSAVNQFTPKTYDIVPWGNTLFLAALLENHCKKNPDERFFLAVNKLAAAMRSQRLTEVSELVETTNEKGQKTFVYRSVLKQLQEYLQKRGLYQGQIDGLWGPGTARALKAYQEASKLPVTSLPDQLTLYTIFRDMAGK